MARSTRSGEASSPPAVQRRLAQAAAEDELAADAAFQAVGGEIGGVDDDRQRLAGLAEGALRRQRIGPGDQPDIGARDARPVEAQRAPAGQRMAGDLAVGQGEAGVDQWPRRQPTPRGKTAVDLRRRHAGEAARVEAFEFALGAEGLGAGQTEFASERQAGAAGAQFEAAQGNLRGGMADLGAQGKLRILQVELQRLAVGGETGAQRPGKAGAAQAGVELRGIQPAGGQCQLEGAGLPATGAGQAARTGHEGVHFAELRRFALPVELAAEAGQRQALPVERAGLRVGQGEATADAVAVRFEVGAQAEPGDRRTGLPGGRIDVAQGDMGAGEGRRGEGREHDTGLALDAGTGQQPQVDAL